MLEIYRPEYFLKLKAFAGRLPNFDYVRTIIHNRLKDRLPGGCWVWRENGVIAAFCGMLYLNPDDAWIYGMRVDGRYSGKGIATRLTRELFGIAKANGRTWAGLNTLHHDGATPVYRVAEKLGMRLEATHATDCFWGLPRRFARPRPEALRGILDHYLRTGQKIIFCEGPGWVWSRLLPARTRKININGRSLLDIPLHIVGHGPIGHGICRREQVTINLYDRPDGFQPLLEPLLGYAAGARRSLTINYPFAWEKEFRRAARKLAGNGHRAFTAWRIYGKLL